MSEQIKSLEVWTTPTHPPAYESLVECVRVGLLEKQEDGTYKALKRWTRPTMEAARPK